MRNGAKGISVAAFTQGQNVASARFRVRQYRAPLKSMGVRLMEYPARFGSFPPSGLVQRVGWLPLTIVERIGALGRAGGAEIGLFQREMVSTLFTVERLWRRPGVMDVDDAVWIKQRLSGVDRLARHVGHVICGNQFIADHFSSVAKVYLLPTGVDTERFCPGTRSDMPSICWSGSAATSGYLEAIEKPLWRAMQEMPGLSLTVVSDRPPRLSTIPASRVKFVYWSPEVEVTAIQSAWLGIMPMPNTDWTKGKCSFKMLCYMACSVPALASPWGMNREVMSFGEGAFGAGDDREWTEMLIDLFRDPTRLQAAGASARAMVLERYSVKALAPRLAGILSQVASA